MRNVLTSLFIGLLDLCRTGPAVAQLPTPLADYVQQGLQNDLQLKQQHFQLQKALLLLQEAQTAFRPTVQFTTAYSTAAGGRQISFPVGQLLNPIYSSLNQITQTDRFPQVADYRENFYPANFYDTRFRTVMPLVNAELTIQKQMQGEQVNALRAGQVLYKRELTRSIRTAYFQYLKATEMVGVYERGFRVLTETERLNKSLVQNGRANPTGQLRIQNERASTRLRIDEARATQQQAALQLNHLLNRAPDAPVVFDSTFRQLRPIPVEMAESRPELTQLRARLSLQRYQLTLAKASSKPKLGLSLDVGSQGRLSTLIGKEQNLLFPNGFFQFGVSIDLPVYTAGRRQLRMAQHQADIDATQLQLEEASRALTTQAQQAELAYRIALSRYEQQKEQKPWVERYQSDVLKQYREGITGYADVLDAQNQVLKQQVEQTLRLYDAWIEWANLERATASETEIIN